MTSAPALDLMRSMGGKASERRDAYNIEVGSRLRLLREALGLTQERFGELLGTTGPNCKNMEHGYQFPTPHQVRRLVSTAMVDYNWVWSGHGKVDPETESKIQQFRKMRRPKPLKTETRKTQPSV